MASFTWKLDLNFNCAFALKSLLPCKYEQINWPHVSFSHFIFSLWQQNKYEKINHLKYIKSRGYDYVKLMPKRHLCIFDLCVNEISTVIWLLLREKKTYWYHGCRNSREPLNFTLLPDLWVPTSKRKIVWVANVCLGERVHHCLIAKIWFYCLW